MSAVDLDDVELGYRGGSFGTASRMAAPVARGLDVHRGATWPVPAAASSQYSLAPWHASQACGRPKVWPRGGDARGAWAPSGMISPVEWLELRFEPGPPTKLVRVFETCAAGAAYAIFVDYGRGFELAWLDAPNQTFGYTAQLLDVTLAEPRDVHAVRVYIDNSQGAWTEIDTVALLSADAPAPLPIEANRPTNAGEVGRARRYTRREIEGVDSLVDARGVWPIAARASSEWNATSYGAAQIVGRPDVWPRAGDRRGAWAPRARSSDFEWIEATFPPNTPPARAIRVFETCSPGCTVEIRVGAGSGLTSVWEGEREDLGKKQARVLEVDLPWRERIERVWCRSATGTPGIFPVSGDLPGAWAPAAGDAAVDWLELAFETDAPASTIRVFETHGAGATFAVTVVYGGGEALVWKDAPVPASGARVLEIELPRPQRIERVGVYVDNAVAGEPQIDSVGLIAK